KSKSLRTNPTSTVQTPLGVTLGCPMLGGIAGWKRPVRLSPSRLTLAKAKHQAQIEQPSEILLFHFFSFPSRRSVRTVARYPRWKVTFSQIYLTKSFFASSLVYLRSISG